jgi:predicted Rossmann fold nucleotide-binding protein DprA/Smf involved in DNA uptake
MPRKAATERKPPTETDWQIVIAPEGLDFTRRNRSKYKDILDKLLDAPNGSVLKLSNPKARASINKQAKAMDLTLAFVEFEGALFVKIVPNKPPKPTSPPFRDARTDTILKLLTVEPKTLKAIAKQTGLIPDIISQDLTLLINRGLVEVDDGIYRRKSVAQTKA